MERGRSLIETVIANKPTNHGIPKKNIRVLGMAEGEVCILRVVEFEGMFQKQVKHIVVSAQVTSEDASMDVLEVV